MDIVLFSTVSFKTLIFH